MLVSVSVCEGVHLFSLRSTAELVFKRKWREWEREKLRKTERERETELLTRQTHAHLLRLLRGGVNQSAIHINVFGPVFQLRHSV